MYANSSTLLKQIIRVKKLLNMLTTAVITQSKALTGFLSLIQVENFYIDRDLVLLMHYVYVLIFAASHSVGSIAVE